MSKIIDSSRSVYRSSTSNIKKKILFQRWGRKEGGGGGGEGRKNTEILDKNSLSVYRGVQKPINIDKYNPTTACTPHALFRNGTADEKRPPNNCDQNLRLPLLIEIPSRHRVYLRWRETVCAS